MSDKMKRPEPIWTNDANEMIKEGAEGYMTTDFRHFPAEETVAALRTEIERLRSINADMLAALKALVQFTDDDFVNSDFQQLWRTARAAIAKAEGKP